MSKRKVKKPKIDLDTRRRELREGTAEDMEVVKRILARPEKAQTKQSSKASKPAKTS